jgi:hypothetical protein
VPYTVCTVHIETRNVDFLVEPQNQGRWFCQWFGLKTTGTVFSGLTSKPVATVSWLSHKTKVVEDFPVLSSKSAAII